MSDRRNYERHLIRKFALLKLTNGDTFKGQTRDMSMGGAFVECDSAISLAEGTECTIYLTLREGEEELVTEIYGSICRSDSQGLGFNFLKINSTYYQFMN
ncbi:MAG: PilZ domain-containing protein, partial [Proteobacteria bacterium]|nr:PilZ domain-containing protein [Pseudomonadota bacterium]MBU1417497.1 PilZ domain-containing protein [Pseudomonadota bacterium]MBU1456186.1 PilZ domain-containing protein [Pseudomonadota bacterium]